MFEPAFCGTDYYYQELRPGIVEIYFSIQFEMKMDGVWIASSLGLEQTVRKLLNIGATLNNGEASNSSSHMRELLGWFVQRPLLTAVWCQHPSVVEVLLLAYHKYII